MEDLFFFYIYIVIATFFSIAGIVLFFVGLGTDKKPLKLAGLVVGIPALQVLVILVATWLFIFFMQGV